MKTAQDTQAVRMSITRLNELHDKLESLRRFSNAVTNSGQVVGSAVHEEVRDYEDMLNEITRLREAVDAAEARWIGTYQAQGAALFNQKLTQPIGEETHA